MSKPIDIAIVGANGRMGRELQRCVAARQDCRISSLVVPPQHLLRPTGIEDSERDPRLTTDVVEAAQAASVIIDFSSPAGLGAAVDAARLTRTPLVTGTTGQIEAQLVALNDASVQVPMLYSANMSVGVQVMVSLLEAAARQLGAGYDVALVETHHSRKKDAPSGTAIRLTKAIDGVRGAMGAPPLSDAAVLSVRGGDVVGDHSVSFMGAGDRLEITHRATARRAFAEGALRAALWLVDQPPGRYDMGDVLGDTYDTRGQTESSRSERRK